MDSKVGAVGHENTAYFKYSGVSVMGKESLLERASFELGNFELRLFVYALSNGGTVVLSKKTMCALTSTKINNVNKQLKTLDFKGIAELDLIEGTVFTLRVVKQLEGGIANV
ncbi:hypothetical protein [Clostridium kluyveri]|uniref:Uncharacterized protein n=1 Tax=Clostridium kluyveri TaxID=1534 RepID=A0A1L5F4Q1_CLOKL|nr:hypothetical protein [Clostridium kluyveri]APM37973.1 hypothetical protein BS101_04110 [Clostridium kluyveri]UZQ52024.1 hypothetical protein OP486_07640 [Clostridium kluyveri]